MPNPRILSIAAAAVLVLLVIGLRSYVSVPAGHAAVATLFGDVRSEPYAQGLHLPVNPLYDWHRYDVRQKTHKEAANVPSQDQLQTNVELSVQYRLVHSDTPRILQETGTAADVLAVHLVPKLRSLLREQGKTIRRAEDFFLETTQNLLQASILEGLREYLRPKGVEVEAVLIRDISLPPFIARAIEAKKEREQEVEKQKAELERFRTEQQQKIAAAAAEREAAEEEAARRRVLADAQAYEINRINQAVGDNPSYVRLQALEALRAISRDPASKLYFMDGSSPMPLPLMHMGESGTSAR
ncbi:MAG: prohibitin family protein [Gammaproteobacteria bacterium]|nr:prohibitin family protein [Gammaproteobacteria bacterium]